MREMLGRMAVIGCVVAAGSVLASAPASASTSASTSDPASIRPVYRNESCPIAFTGPQDGAPTTVAPTAVTSTTITSAGIAPAGIDVPWAEMECVTPRDEDREYGLGALLWIGPDWGEPTLGSYAAYDF